jgi:hypothetical protein
LQDNVFRNVLHTAEELQAAIIQEVGNITPNMLVNVFESLKRRVNLCLEINGGHFEHYLCLIFRVVIMFVICCSVFQVSLERLFLFIHNLQFCRCLFHVKYQSKDVSGCSIANSRITKCS